MSDLVHDPLPQAHPCTTADCPNIVPYDDEPKCFTHSPDSGSSVPGYSYRESNTCKYIPLVYKTAGDAARIVTELVTLAQRRSTVTVAELHELSGVTGHFTDSQWGWTKVDVMTFDLKDVDEGGWELVLPDPKHL